MADQDPTRRKDKRKADEYEDGESSAVRRRVVRELTRQYGGGDGNPGPGIPGQDAPLLVNQPHGHLMGQQQQHGGSSSRHGLQLQAPALGDSQLQPMGSLPQSPLLPQYSAPAAASGALQTGGGYWATVWEVSRLCQDPMVRRQFQDRDQQYKMTHPSPVPEDRRCPTCHYYERWMEDLPRRHDCPCAVCHILYAVVCVECLSASSAPAGMGLPGQDQAAVASRPVGQRGVGPGGSAAQLGQPDLQPGQQACPVLPADQPVGLRRQTAPPRPHQHPRPPPPVGAGVQQPQNQLAVAIRPVGRQRGEVPGGSAFQPCWRPGLQPPPLAAHPVPGPGAGDQPVVVLPWEWGAMAVPEHLRCPFCRIRPGWLATRSPQHVCLCNICVSYGVVCHVCVARHQGHRIQ